MFDYLSGKIVAVRENRVVLDCGGVGFALVCSANACAEYSRKTEAKVPVYLAVREDALELFGFVSEREREVFMSLIGVSGVGAKLAVGVLGGMSLDGLIAAIADGNAATLSSIKGIGKKTAERIVVELKSGFAEFATSAAPTADGGAVDEQALNALIGLGYDKREAETAVKKVNKSGMTTEQIVFAVLHG